MLKISFMQKGVIVLVVLALMVGVFTLNFMQPGHAIDVAAGRNKNNNSSIAPNYIDEFGQLAPQNGTMRNLLFTHPNPKALKTTLAIKFPTIEG